MSGLMQGWETGERVMIGDDRSIVKIIFEGG